MAEISPPPPQKEIEQSEFVSSVWVRIYREKIHFIKQSKIGNLSRSAPIEGQSGLPADKDKNARR